MDAGALRAEMLLEPGLAFLNHGSYGACPAEVFAVYQDWQRRLERQPVAFLDPLHQALLSREVRQALAAEVGARPQDLAGVVNATEALNIALMSLGLRPGDEIVTTDHEYAAMEKTLTVLCRQTGAVVRRATVPLPLVSESALADAVLGQFGPRTRMLFISQITSPTALHLPLARLAAAARAAGATVVVDGAHGPGHLPLDLWTLGADVYAGNCHKWMMAPKGAGFLWLAPSLQDRVVPRIVSHGWEEDGQGPFTGSGFLDRIEMQGTRDRAAWFAVPAALDWQRARDWGAVKARAQALCSATEARVCAMSGLAPLAAGAFRAPQMAAMEVPPGDPRKLHHRLLSGFGIEIPCILWGGRRLVRLSVAGYTTGDECDRLVAALAEIFGWKCA